MTQDGDGIRAWRFAVAIPEQPPCRGPDTERGKVIRRHERTEDALGGGAIGTHAQRLRFEGVAVYALEKRRALADLRIRWQRNGREDQLASVGRRDVDEPADRKSTRLNSRHLVISYAVFWLKKKKNAKSAKQ